MSDPPYLSPRTTKVLGSVMCGAHFVFSAAALLLAPVVQAASDPQAQVSPNALSLVGLVGVGFGALVLLVALWYEGATLLRRIGAVVLAASTLLLLVAVSVTSGLVGVIYGGEVCFVGLMGFVLVKLPKPPGTDDRAADASLSR